MTTTPAQAYRQALVRWTDGVRRLAWLVVAASVLLSAAAAVYLAENIRINTDTGDMLSADLAFRRHSAELDKAFPQFSDNLIVVIDGDSPDLSDDAARALAERKDKGMQINEVAPAEVQRMREQAAPAIQKGVDTVFSIHVTFCS